MERLVSLSTAQRGLTLAAREKFGPDSQWAQRDYRLGDMNTTLIRTARGKTILIQHDVTSPRPYNRLHTISGTKGFAQKYPVETIALDPNAHAPLPERQRDSLLSVYEHPIAREIGEKARQVGGHGGMDFIMDYRLIYCLRNGLPLDMDVYDAAEWSSLVELTEASAEHGGMPVLVPDFTRGRMGQGQRLLPRGKIDRQDRSRQNARRAERLQRTREKPNADGKNQRNHRPFRYGGDRSGSAGRRKRMDQRHLSGHDGLGRDARLHPAANQPSRF